jgi:CubicO group peptidase (beta-lactamase class C family)
MTRLLGSVVVALIALELTGRAPAADDVAGRIDMFVQSEMARQHVPGVAIGVVRGGAVFKAQGYGYANIEHMVPVGPETIFQSGSLGKQFTAAAVMLQIERRRLGLDDAISKFFPDAPPSWNAIKVRHLLTHTSGIPDYTDGTIDLRRDYTEDDFVKFAFGLPLEFPAGSRWNYSNTGYVLLGAIVRKVSGRFYGDVLADEVFKQLGMTTARVISEADIVPHRAAGYRLDKGELKNQEWVAPSLNTTADGALYFSVRDLLAWDAGVHARKVLSADSWNQILTPVRLASGKPFPYGFGWGIEERAGYPLHQHGGSWQGFKTHYARFVRPGDEELSVIALTNLQQADPAAFVEGIATIVNPALALPAPKPIPDREPQVTARVKQLVEVTRRGGLSPSDFAYARAGFFPSVPGRYARELAAAGDLRSIALVERTDLGDDRIYLYELTFARTVMRLRIALAPDDRLAGLALTAK